MKKVVIASKNPVKIQAVKNGFKRMFAGQNFTFLDLSSSSGVSSQPFGDEETLLGAQNRIESSTQEEKDADFYVGIEGGVQHMGSEIEVFAWVVIKSMNKYGKAKTGTFFLPEKIAQLVREGKELGEADDLVFGLKDSKRKSGAVGILTGNIIDREKYYTEAVILSLIPFKNPDLY